MSKLTQIELIQAILDCKKVRKKYWESWTYVYKEDEHILTSNGGIFDLNFSGDWELYNQDVTFFEALEAMKEGKKVKCLHDFITLILYINEDGYIVTKGGIHARLHKDHFEAKWQILEAKENE